MHSVPKKSLRGKPLAHPHYTPYATFLYAAICTVLYFLIPDPLPYLTTPFEVIFIHTPSAIGRLVLAQFLHHGFDHLFFNMLLLTLPGYALETRWGFKRMCWLFLASGLGAAILHCGATPFSITPFLGASGVVFGVLTAWALRPFLR